MTTLQKLASLGLVVLLLLVLGTGGGVWLAARHYRPLLDTANTDMASVKAARNNLEALAGEQGKKLGELVQAGEQREQDAARAQAKASEESRPDYTAANRLLQERIGGEPAQAASAIIDQELGL